MQTPTTVTKLRRFMGMVNQLGKFTPQPADLTQPLRGLLSKGNAWVWGPDQDKAFTQVKEELSKPTQCWPSTIPRHPPRSQLMHLRMA